jgi:predicted RNA-binding Zn ribbon-like protein
LPRYDLPNAAPEPLRLVQRFVNTLDHEHGREWIGTPAELSEWLGAPAGEDDLRRAHELREALRALLRANNGGPLEPDAVATLGRAASRLRLELDSRAGVAIVGEDALDRVVAVALGAILDGSWQRLKACPNCCWAFYDYSRNRSASWCSMQLCGNRLKTRAYRRRRARA